MNPHATAPLLGSRSVGKLATSITYENERGYPALMGEGCAIVTESVASVADVDDLFAGMIICGTDTDSLYEGGGAQRWALESKRFYRYISDMILPMPSSLSL